MTETVYPVPDSAPPRPHAALSPVPGAELRPKARTRRPCAWCGIHFPARPNQDYCGDSCRVAWNNWAKGWGPRLIQVLFAWRYVGRRLNISHVCQAIGDCRDDLARRRTLAAKTRDTETLKIIDKNAVSGPLVKAFDANGDATTALIDAHVQEF